MESPLALTLNQNLDLGDLILFELGDTIGRLRVLTGADRPAVALGNGVEVQIEEQDPHEPCRDRLVRLQAAVCLIADASPDADRDEVCRAVLEADGWSWTAATFRTPVWMIDHQELPRDEVAHDFEVLAWLDGSSSATR
jgi:hypothetical protein